MMHSTLAWRISAATPTVPRLSLPSEKIASTRTRASAPPSSSSRRRRDAASGRQILPASLLKVGVMFFEDLAHGAVHGMRCAAGGDKFLLAEDFNQDRGFRSAPDGFRRLKINLVVSLTAQDAKRLQAVFPLANRHELERRPCAVESEKSSLRSFAIGPPVISKITILKETALLYIRQTKSPEEVG
jgi:hypothetical protein